MAAFQPGARPVAQSSTSGAAGGTSGDDGGRAKIAPDRATTTSTGRTTGQTPSFDQTLPRVFGRYLLLKRLSRGGMGEIFLAKLGEIQGFEKLVIVKKILPNLVADQEFVKRFIDEAQVAIKLQHANIAPVFEVGKVDGEYFLALEYIEGRDLRKLVARQREERVRMPADLCLFIARELANGLAYAHRKTDNEGRSLALVHCDISPPNVMVSFEGEVKVIDFGIAKSAIRIAGTNPNMGFGKFGYMAPEQLVRGGVVDRRTDIYAAGVVLYELLTGERLFQFPEGADYRQIARMVTAGKITPPSVRDPRLDPELDALVMRALATQKEDRYQTGEEFRDAIQTKLSQLNPTINADSLAHYMRQLFADDITEERRLVESMKAVDVAPFQEELTAATTQHTVTFARALQGSKLLNKLGSVSNASMRAISTDEMMRAHPRRRTLFFVGAGVAMLLGSGVAFLAARSAVHRPATSSTPANTTPAPVVEPVAPAPPSPPVVTAITPPPATAPAPAPAAPPAPATPSAPRAKSKRAAAAKEKPSAAPPPAPTAHHSPEAVQAKFRTVKQEYASFKSQYGSVLEERWNAIANEITFGKADTKYDKVDGMLDGLRREMAKHRAD
jgi:serine/threonine-protein kinase